MTQAQQELVVIRPFRFAHEGIRVQEFTPDAQQKPVPMTARCAEVALKEGWARRPLPAKQEIPAPAPAPAVETADETLRGGPNPEQGDRPLDGQPETQPNLTDPGRLSGDSGQEQPSSALLPGRRSRRSR